MSSRRTTVCLSRKSEGDTASTPTLALWGFRDPDGDFATAAVDAPGMATNSDTAVQAGRDVAQLAKQRLRREPDSENLLLWLLACIVTVTQTRIWLAELTQVRVVVAAAGQEENVLSGVREVFKKGMLMGTTSAARDVNNLQNTWQFAKHGESSRLKQWRGVALVVMCPSVQMALVHTHGYGEADKYAQVVTPPGHHCRGHFTKLIPGEYVNDAFQPEDGREEGAWEVYNRWTNDKRLNQAKSTADKKNGADILAPSSRFPLCVEESGTQTNTVYLRKRPPAHLHPHTHARTPCTPTQPHAHRPWPDRSISIPALRITRCLQGTNRMLHPAKVTVEGYMEVFASIQNGEIIQMCAGTTKSIIKRVREKPFLDAAAENREVPFKQESVIGSLSFFCAGCAGSVLQDGRGEDLSGAMRKAVVDKPFITVIPYGEQVCNYQAE